jgi:hypothetical protein
MKLARARGLLVFGLCVHGQDVHYNYDRDANFAKYRTYRWVEISRASNW